MVTQITNWLQGFRPYLEGVALYEQYGSSAVLKRMFAIGETAYNQSKLEQALESLIADHNGPNSVHPTHSYLTNTLPISKEGYVKTLESGWKSIYKESAYLHTQLEHVDWATRQELALTICSNMQKITAIKADIKVIETTGHPPAPDAPAIERDLTDPVELYKEIKRLGVRISKHKGKPEKAEEVAKWIKQKEELERRTNHAAA